MVVATSNTLFTQVQVRFEKHYRRRHSEDYDGTFTFGLKRIIGTYFNGSDIFEMNFEDPKPINEKQSDEKKCAQLFCNFRNFFSQQVSQYAVNILFPALGSPLKYDPIP